MTETKRSLGRELHATLGRVMPQPGRVALLGRPDHHNVGDHAIWVAEHEWLSRNAYQIVYSASPASYSEDVLRTALARGAATILLQGGGNLGDVWPDEHRFRCLVLRAFPDVTTVQLPQSVHFQSSSKLEEFVELARAHSDYRVLVRDRASLGMLHDQGLAPVLCPDMVFALTVTKPRPPTVPLVSLLRKDREASAHEALPGSVDWAADSGDSRMDQTVRRWLLRTRHVLERAPRMWRIHERVAMRWSRRRLRKGLAMLGNGEVVITDRLHGVLLALLLGRPSIALDNRIGKLGAFHETWLGDTPVMQLAVSVDDALDRLRTLRALGSEAPATPDPRSRDPDPPPST